MTKYRWVIWTAIAAVAAIVFIGSHYVNKQGNDSPSPVSDFRKLIIAEGTQPIASPIYIAFANGYFKDQGLNVELVSFPTGKLCLDAVIGGNADFATAAETPIMHAAFKKQPIRIVSTIHRSKKNTFLVGRKDLGIATPIDLKGRIVAVPVGTNAEYALEAFLEKIGLSSKDIKVINLSPPEMIGPLSNSEIAAVVAWQPHVGRCEKALGNNAIRFSFEGVYQETYNLVANTSMANDRADITSRVLSALNAAVDFMAQHPDESISIVSKRLGMDREELAQLWPIYSFGLDLDPSLIEMLTSQANWAIARGHQSGEIPDMATMVSPKALEIIKSKR